MATQTTPTSPKAWAPDQTVYVAGDVIPDATILHAATMVGKIEGDEPAVRVPFVLDDGDAAFTAEGTVIGDANQQFSETVVKTHKVSAVGKYSYETLQQPEAANLVVDSLSRSIVRYANAAFLGNADDPTGLLNDTNIIDGGIIEANLDPVVDAIAGIEASYGQASTIIAAPDAWASLSKLKTGTDFNSALLGAGVEAGQRQLLGLPVLVTPAMTSGSVLVLDRNAVIGASSGIRLARSEDAFFTADVVAVRVTWRLGWAVMRPERVVKLAVTTDDDESS